MAKTKKRNSEIYSLKQVLLTSLSKKHELARVLFGYKNIGEYKYLNQAITELSKTAPIFEYLVYGTLLPRKFSDLGKCKIAFIKPISVENEIKWTLNQIHKCKAYLEDMIKIKTDVETCIILGQYEDALRNLERMQNKYGVSMWLIEMNILIYYRKYDINKVVEYVSKINTEQKGLTSGFVSYLTYFLYKKCNPKISAYEFDTELENEAKRNSSTFSVDRFNYFKFRLNFLDVINTIDYTPVLLMESTNSILDRYESLVNVLRALFVTDKLDKDLIVTYAKKLYNLSNDERLQVFLAYGNEAPASYFDKEFVEVLDLYYTGYYQECIVSSKLYLRHHPQSFDIIKIYCRSLLFQRKGFSCITSEDSILNSISDKVYKVLEGNNVEHELYALYQIQKNVSGLQIAIGLACFIKEEQNKLTNKQLKCFTSLCFDPYGVYMYKKREERIRFLNSAISRFGESESLKYQKNRYSDIISDDDNIVAYIRKLDNAKILYSKGDYIPCIDILLPVEADYHNDIPVRQTAARVHFDSLIQLEKYQEAISYYIANCLEDRSIVLKIDTGGFSKFLRKKRYKGVVRYTLDFLLFMFVSEQENTARAAVLEGYCEYKDVDKIEDLIAILGEIEKEKVEDLIYNIVSSDVLRHTKFINSTKQMLETNINLIRYALDHNPQRKKEFKELNDELSTELIVYTGMRKMDESKIYANVPAIMKYELDDAKLLYEQFKTHESLYVNKTILLFFSKLGADYKGDGLCQPVQFTDNAISETAVPLFNSILTPFLKSKFGIGTYLSTRIRHGVFESKLQYVFINHNLMLTQENGKYVNDTYWRRTYGLNSLESKKLNDSLVTLSTSINRLITDFKNNVLQIKVNDKEVGYFDYRFTELEICLAVLRSYKETKDFDDFSFSLIQFFFEATNRGLIKIRNKISVELKASFNKLLDTLESEMRGVGNSKMQQDFSETINQVRSEINTQLYLVEHWFYLQDCKFDDFSFTNHLDIVWNSLCQTHPNIKCELNYNRISPDIMIAGEYGINFSNLLSIIFVNMMTHSKNESIKRFIMKSTKVDQILHLHFENNFEGDEDMTNQKIQKLLNSYELLAKEGGSGLVKARKIVKYDLLDDHNEVLATIQNGKCLVDITINLDKICPKTNC